jgi:UPF0271 protein
MSARDEAVAGAICDAADVFGVPLYGLADTVHEQVYTARGLSFVSEFYADLDYAAEGRVIITREHEAIDPVAAAARTQRAVTEGRVMTIDGGEIAVRADSVCVHSDTPGAVAVAAAVRNIL